MSSSEDRFPAPGHPFEPAVACALAAAVGLYVPLPLFARLAAAFVAGGISVAVSGYALLSGTERRSFRFFGAAALAVAVGLGLSGAWGWALSTAQQSVGTGLHPDRITRIRGRLSADSSPTKSGTRYAILVEESAGALGERASASAPVVAFADGGGPRLYAGERVAVECRLRSGRDGYVAFGARILAAPPIALSAGTVIDLDAFGSRILAARSCVLAAFESASARVGTVSAPLQKALLLGLRDDLDNGVTDLFVRSGCAHILALSGQHLAALAALVVAVSSRVAGSSRALAFSVVVVCAYTAVVGAGASVFRSALMFAHVAIGRLCGRPTTARNALAVSFITMTTLDPATAFGWSFLLSYLAMVGLVWLAPRFEFALRPYMPPALSVPLAASFGSFVATTPFCAFSFGAMYPAGAFISLVACPLSAIFLWVGALGAPLIAIFPQVAPFVSTVSDAVYAALLMSMRVGAGVPAIDTASPLAACVPIAVVALIATLVYAFPHVRYARFRNAAQD